MQLKRNLNLNNLRVPNHERDVNNVSPDPNRKPEYDVNDPAHQKRNRKFVAESNLTQTDSRMS